MPEIGRLRSAGSSWEKIRETKYPDRTTQQVRYAFVQQCKEHSLEQYGSNRQSDGRGRNGRRPFRIPLADIAEVRRLRETKMTWAAIAALMYPKTNRESLRVAYVAQTGASTRAQRAPSFDIPSAIMSDIQRLRHEGKTWDEITDMKYPGRKSRSLRRAVLQQDNGSGEYRKPYPSEISSADMADIKRLRHEGKTWDQIRDMKYPGCRSSSLRRDVLQRSNGPGEYQKPGPSKMSPAEIADVKRLRQEGKTWEQIRVMKFPARSVTHVRISFHKQYDSLSEPGRQRSLQLSPADIADIQRLLAAGQPWKEIGALKYPDRSWWLVRLAFLRQDGNRSDHYRPITPAMLEDIRRLRAANTKWHEIGTMYLPQKHPKAAREFILRRMEKLYGAENKQMYMYNPGPQPFEIPPADHEEIKRLLEAGTSWEEIARLKYPDQKSWTVRRAILRHKIQGRSKRNGRPPAVEIGLKDIKKIAHLREKGATWQEIRETMYPDRSSQSVRMALMRANARKECAMRLGRPPAIKLRSIDVQSIKRLRKSKLTWEAVTALMYPDQNPQTVRLAFLRATVDKATRTKESVAKNKEEQEKEEEEEEKEEEEVE
ncbi:hypothetical protein MBLNU13_g06618t2 [Cladosporium sp. NU13]